MEITGTAALADPETLEAAQRGDRAAFDALVKPLQAELHAHCYRMLGSAHDADDALQEALLGAWRGLAGFEERSSLRSWFYRITTNACMRLGGQRRLVATEYCLPRDPAGELGAPVTETAWVEPYPDHRLDDADPALRAELLESVELAFVAALQHLPATQRAVLILREVLAFSAQEVAELLDSTVASVNSALQRARKSLHERYSGPTQRAELHKLGEPGRAELVAAFVAAWERADVPALLDLLVSDARFTMPPLPAWFEGKAAVGRFAADRLFATPWRLVPMHANGQLAFTCYQAAPDGAEFVLGAVNVLTLRDGKILEISGFVDPAMYADWGVPKILGADR